MQSRESCIKLLRERERRVPRRFGGCKVQGKGVSRSFHGSFNSTCVHGVVVNIPTTFYSDVVDALYAVRRYVGATFFRILFLSLFFLSSAVINLQEDYTIRMILTTVMTTRKRISFQIFYNRIHRYFQILTCLYSMVDIWFFYCSSCWISKGKCFNFFNTRLQVDRSEFSHLLHPGTQKRKKQQKFLHFIAKSSVYITAFLPPACNCRYALLPYLYSLTVRNALPLSLKPLSFFFSLSSRPITRRNFPTFGGRTEEGVSRVLRLFPRFRSLPYLEYRIVDGYLPTYLPLFIRESFSQILLLVY